jgi:tetratricopeptide (TPR) repeat protein
MENDPLYQEGLKHFGLGQWTEAVACFSQLQGNYPDDPRVKQFLETAQLRASASASASRRPTGQGVWLRRLSWLGVAVILLLIAGGIFLAYQSWVVPVQAENARLARLEELRNAAEIQVASGAYTEAISTYQTLLAEEPEDPVAKAGLARTQRLVTIGELYAQATAALNAGDQAQAQQFLEKIAVIDPNYRDAGSLLAQIKATQDLEQQYQAALQLEQAQRWLDAALAFEQIRSLDRNFKPQEIADYLYNDYFQMAERRVQQASTIGDIESAETLYQKALSARPLDPAADQARRLSQAFLNGAAAYQAKNWEDVIRLLGPVQQQQPDYFGGQVRRWLFEAFMTTGEMYLSKSDPFLARDRFAEAVRLAKTSEEQAAAQQKYDAANRLTTPTPTVRPSPTPLPAGHIAPSWTRRPTGTPSPYPFQLVNTTYLPNTFNGEGCRWAGVAGRFYDRKGAPLVLPSLGVRITGPSDIGGAAAGSNQLIGESGWMAQFDVRPKKIDGFIQVYYKDQPASDLIPYQTHKSCLENMLILDVQQVKPLP